MNEKIVKSRLSAYSLTSIVVRGFECIDKDLEKIRWLRLGDDFRTFITRDVDQSIHEQDPESVVHSITCEYVPNYLLKEDPLTVGKQEAIILEFAATFFFESAGIRSWWKMGTHC